MALILGIDDAGRGPLIGPMILAGVLMEKKDEPFLKKHGVNDSKQLTHPIRIELAKLIEQTSLAFHVVKSFPDQIDHAIQSGMNLNTLEAMKTAEIINELNDTKMQKQKIKVIVDCPSVNITAWTNKLIEFIKHKDNLDISCEHKADANHPAVSAASILAKVEREKEVAKLKEEFQKYGNLGSGYPSDPDTKLFLKKHGKELKDSGIFRKSWATWKALFPDAKQSTLF
jgi:ribonuclease HII